MKRVVAWVVFNFVLFFVLAPGNFVTLPANANSRTVAATHAALFAAAHVVLGSALKGVLSR